MTDPGKSVICLLGPTASGKTDLAVKLVERFPLDIISVDSAMVYKGMDIGTAKPDAETLQRAPHRLIDFVDPAQAYSVARFCSDAQREIESIHLAGRIPLLVGGTMMYFRSLLQGLDLLPPADESIRAALLDEAKQTGWLAMHQQLAAVDAQAASRIHPNDPQRISRALEVYRITGIPLTEWQQGSAKNLPHQVTMIGLVPSDRSVLHERIARRFSNMLDSGLVDEVRRLHARGDLNIKLPAIRAVGYRQVWSYLEGELGYTDMQDKAIAATRQLAKRQLTWMRSMPELINIDCLNNDLDDIVLKIVTKIHIN